MGRPRRPLRYIENGGSLKVFDEFGYAGSISLRELAARLRRERKSPDEVYKETALSGDKVQLTD